MLQVRFFSPLSGNVGGRFWARPTVGHFSTLATDLDRWQRRLDRLTHLQRRICFPPLETITVAGRATRLPLPAVEAVRSPIQEELDYLVGFFDGDGCVSLSNASGQVQLAISQSVDSAEVLLRFRSMLGGSVCRQAASTGSKKAKVRWQVYGSKMTAAAETLSKVPSLKQAQLLIAANGCVAAQDRTRVARCLQVLKQRHHVPDQWKECSWPYFAGFFDAEGCIVVRPLNAGLQLRLDQVNPFVLLHLLNFLHEKQLDTWSLYHYASHSTLSCQTMDDSKRTLEQLLVNGLLVKRRQALLALALSAQNHLQIREAISSLNGLQGRYQRLDTDGITRSREIQRLQKRLYRISGPEHASLFSHIEELRAEHQLQKLISRCDLLRKDMR